MIHNLLFVAILFLGQDEAEYPLLLGELRTVIQNFREPDDGVVIRPRAYWERALALSREIERFEPTSTRELHVIRQLVSGMVALTKGNTREATAEFQYGIKLDPNQSALFHYALGLSASAAAQPDVSEREFKAAAERAPHWAAPKTALASIYLGSGRAGEARELLRESLDLNLTDIDAVKSRQYLLLAQILDVQNNPKDAEGALRTAIELDPRNPTLADYLGIHLLNTQGRKAAIETWKMAAGAFPEEPALVREIALSEDGLQVAATEQLSVPAKGELSRRSPQLPGGARFRAYRVQARAGDDVKLRVESRAFQPFAALLGPDGKAVAMQQIRSSSFSVLDYKVTEPGTYRIIVSSYAPDQVGDFELK